MLTDWIHWLCSRRAEQVFSVLCFLLLTEGPRYTLAKIAMCWWDWALGLWRHLLRGDGTKDYSHCPSVCVVIAGYNESKTIAATLASLWGTYPRLQIVVVDDGSLDGMFAVAQEFARQHAGVVVLRRPRRGGKSSALNFGLQYARAEIVLSVDADSHLAPGAIREIVQPFRDPRVGAVFASVLARNPFVNLVTWMQAYEYLHSIFVGRLVAARLGILGIGSGALTAFRRSALDQTMGWDVAPGEDLDLTLRVRKSGYKIAFAQYAQCFTNLPTRWRALIRQRMRWERSGVIRNHCRKHIDMAYVWSPNFNFANFCVVCESWLFTVFCTFATWAWLAWACFYPPADFGKVVCTLYGCYLVAELVHVLTALYYSNEPRRDALICVVWPLAPVYQLLLSAVRLAALLEELVLRRSFDDDFSPRHVRDATWRW